MLTLLMGSRVAVVSILAPLVVSLASIGFPLRASAVAIIDQQSLDDTGSISYGVNSLAQSFTPTFTTLAFVDAAVGCCDAGTAELRFDVRDGGIAGPVIGSTNTLVLPNPTSGVFVQFELSPPIALTPGNTYVIELVHVSGGSSSWRRGRDFYPGGEAFANGSGGAADMVFRTGILSDEVPQTIAAGGGVPVEYSNDLDERALAGGGQGPGDPGQILYTEPPDDAANSLPSDTTDFFPGIESGNEPDAQVDALAHGVDVLYPEVIDDAADLVVSLTGDMALGGGEVAAVVESVAGVAGILYTQSDLDTSDGPGVVEDVDGLDLWGPVGTDDAFYYSRVDDAASGTSVYVDVGGTPSSFLSHAAIVAAVTTLGYGGAAANVDLDALMVRNVGAQVEFELGDEILFSIRDVPTANFDGGEIIRLPFGGPPSFLAHGGHTWDTAFGVVDAFGSTSEDVDAIEASPSSPAVSVPALGRWPAAALGLLLAGLPVHGALAARRRRLPTPAP